MRGSKYQSHGNKVEDKALGRMMEEHNLSVVLIEDWMLIQRANFDLRVDEEPYHSLQVYANLGARRFMVRVWGRTICSGEVTSITELNSLCADYFKSRVACVGHLGSHPGATGNQEFVTVDYPCQRWVSRACAVTYFKAEAAEDDSVGICPACSDTNRQSYRVRPEPLRTAKQEDIPVVTLSDDDDDDQFVGELHDDDDEDAQISDESDIGLDNLVAEESVKAVKAKTTKRIREKLPKAVPVHAKKQTTNEKPAAPLPPKRTPRPGQDGGPKYNCKHCEKDFVNRAALNDHKISHLTDFDCDDCGKRLSNKNKLKEHKRLHTGEAPFRCPHCEWRGKTSSTLSKHKAVSHVGFGDKAATTTTKKAVVGRPAKVTSAESHKTLGDRPAKITRLDRATAKRAVGKPTKFNTAKVKRITATHDAPENNTSAEMLSVKRRRRPPSKWEIEKPAEVAASRAVTRSRSTWRNPGS